MRTTAFLKKMSILVAVVGITFLVCLIACSLYANVNHQKFSATTPGIMTVMVK